MGNDESSETKCAICGKPAKQALVGLGWFCSAACKQKLIDEDKAYKEELLAEGVEVMPDEFDLQTFERYMLKVSLHFLKTLPTDMRKKWMKKCPLMLSPDDLCLELKDRVLKQMPLNYVSSMDAEGHVRLFHGGTYMFKRKVPKNVIVDAMTKAKVFKRAPEKGDE